MSVRRCRVAVISQNTALIEFFRLEALFCGCPVQVMSEPPTTLAGLDRVILDVRVGYCATEHPACRVAAVVYDGEERLPFHTDAVWEWPVPIREVRQFFEGISEWRETNADPVSENPIIYILSESQRQLLYRNRTVTLTPHGWRLLLCLGEHSGETVPRELLAETLGEEKGNMTDVYVHHLRKKLEEPFGIRLIRTVRGLGYRLDARVVRGDENL